MITSSGRRKLRIKAQIRVFSYVSNRFSIFDNAVVRRLRWRANCQASNCVWSVAGYRAPHQAADIGRRHVVERHTVRGLCASREEHAPHLVTDGSLAPYWCTAKQSERLPYAAERRRSGIVQGRQEA